jgi:hypothetical protein
MDLFPLKPVTIRTLRATIGRELALSRLAPSGLGAMLRRVITGKLMGLSELYIPYRLYKVTVYDRRLCSTRYLAMDAVSGHLDPYEFREPHAQEYCAEIETRNCLPARITETAAQALVLDKSRRLLFSGGFFRLTKPVMAAEMIGSEFYIPYWAGFYGGEQNLNVLVLDAMRGTVEGSKVSQLVKDWLLEQPEAAR